MYDGVATLLKDGERTYDAYGNETIAQEQREVYVQPRGVYQSEFYNAAQNGLRPSLTLFIASKEDYSGETELVYEGRKYAVIRVDWSAQRDGISLVCEEKVGKDG